MKSPRIPLVLLALAVCLLPGAPAAAQQDEARATFAGRLTSASGEPVVGYRVVFRAEDDPLAVWVSPATDADGRYRLELPAGVVFVPAAVITPRGRRLDLGAMPGIEGAPGAVRELQLEVAMPDAGTEEPRPFRGADRLFLQYVEDAGVVEEGRRVETTFGLLGLTGADAMRSQLTAVAGFESIPNLEFGARVGFVGTDFDRGPDATGLTDADVWARLWLGPRLPRGARLAVGALATLPVGDEDTGFSADALRTKLFGAARWNVGSRVTMTAHVGLRANEDARIGGVGLDGNVAPAVGVGALVPFRDRLVLVGEATWEGERFDGGDPDARVLAGVSWAPLAVGMVRAAVGFGLTDGAPDSEILVGYAVAF